MSDAKVHVDIRALAQLARLELSDTEVAKLELEIPGILVFVETIQNVSTDALPKSPMLHNVLREDTDPHQGGIHTEDLISAAPAREGNKIAVKQVVKR